MSAIDGTSQQFQAIDPCEIWTTLPFPDTEKKQGRNFCAAGGRDVDSGGVECNTPGQSCTQTVVNGNQRPPASPGQSLQPAQSPGSATQQPQGIINEGYSSEQANKVGSPVYNTGVMCSGTVDCCPHQCLRNFFYQPSFMKPLPVYWDDFTCLLYAASR